MSFQLIEEYIFACPDFPVQELLYWFCKELLELLGKLTFNTSFWLYKAGGWAWQQGGGGVSPQKRGYTVLYLYIHLRGSTVYMYVNPIIYEYSKLLIVTTIIACCSRYKRNVGQHCYLLKSSRCSVLKKFLKNFCMPGFFQLRSGFTFVKSGLGCWASKHQWHSMHQWHSKHQSQCVLTSICT